MPAFLSLSGFAIAMVSCGSVQNLSQPLSGDDSFDPLTGPGSSSSTRSASVTPSSPTYEPGQWVETAVKNTSFFRKYPILRSRPDKTLDAGEPVKIISSRGSYVKAELDSGEVGYIPSIMVIERPALLSPSAPTAPTAPSFPNLGTIPPPLDPIDTTGGTLAPPPSVPGLPDFNVSPSGTPPPVVPASPTVPAVPSLPDLPSSIPSSPNIAPPPEIPGL